MNQWTGINTKVPRVLQLTTQCMITLTMRPYQLGECPHNMVRYIRNWPYSPTLWQKPQDIPGWAASSVMTGTCPPVGLQPTHKGGPGVLPGRGQTHWNAQSSQSYYNRRAHTAHRGDTSRACSSGDQKRSHYFKTGRNNQSTQYTEINRELRKVSRTICSRINK